MEGYERFCIYIRTNNLQGLELMLKQGFEMNKEYYNTSGFKKCNILYITIRDGTEKVLELLLKNGLDPNFGDDLPEVHNPDHVSILETVMRNAKNSYFGSSSKYFYYVELLIKYGANPEFIRDEKMKKEIYEKYFYVNIKPAK